MATRTVDARLLEVVADIALIAGHHRFYSGDSRADIHAMIGWAHEFEAGFTQEQEDDGQYMELVEKFAETKLREAGCSTIEANAAPTPATDEPQFTDTEDPENPLGLAELLSANEHDPEFCAWARAAKIGDRYTVGGGAAAEYHMTRVS